MLQTFTETARPEDSPPRIQALREAIAEAGLDGFVVPRADAHQGEYVAECDARLAWLTGFTGSAGFAVVLRDRAALFVDGRYRVQARAQVPTDMVEIVAWPDTTLADWLKASTGATGTIGFDPWLHTIGQLAAHREALDGSAVTLAECANLVDRIWADRPAPPAGQAVAHPDDLAGRSAPQKRSACADDLVQAGHDAAVLTLPDSISWLLNIRGSDVPRIPVVQAFAILHADARLDLFTDPAKLDGLADHLGPDVTIAPADRFDRALRGLSGRVRVDKASAPVAVQTALAAAGATPVFARDPCVMPKACKTDAEIAGAEAAHLRDGAAMVEFLAWLDTAIEGDALTEIAVVRALEDFRAATGALSDIAFDTIAGSGPHGAIVHYRVTKATDRAPQPGEVLLIDSGGQYADGTTDITRTVPVGTPDAETCRAYTRVLKGMIAVSAARFPESATGRDIDTLARQHLWAAGQDYDHGTGHGVGAYLSVHEGPQRLARSGNEALRPGMIVSNEPGYYREGAFGVRIENLIRVVQAPPLDGADDRAMLAFRTLTHVPIDRRPIVTDMLTDAERAWLNAYHAETRRRLAGRVSDSAKTWLETVTKPI